MRFFLPQAAAFRVPILFLVAAALAMSYSAEESLHDGRAQLVVLAIPRVFALTRLRKAGPRVDLQSIYGLESTQRSVSS